MTTSIPIPAANLAPINSTGTPGPASLSDILAAGPAGTAGSPPGLPGQPGPNFASCLANPAAAGTSRAQLPAISAGVGGVGASSSVQLSQPVAANSPADKPAQAKADGKVSRDAVETVAALLAPLFQSLHLAVLPLGQTTTNLDADLVVAPVAPPLTQPAVAAGNTTQLPSTSVGLPLANTELPTTGQSTPTLNATDASKCGGAAAPGTSQPDDRAAQPLQAVIDFGPSFPSLTIDLPGLRSPSGQLPSSATELRQTMVNALERALAKAGVSGTPTAPAGTLAPTVSPPSILVTINVPPASADAPSGLKPAGSPVIAEAAAAAVADGVAKIAGDVRRGLSTNSFGAVGSEKQFLIVKGNGVKTGEAAAGISVAQPEDNMPANFTARRNAANLAAPALPIVLREVAAAGSNFPAPTAPATPTASPAPVLAHRAVETVLNVLEAQSSSAAGAGVVNLHFKFGGEDLAVRVQMRGGEVHTQFNTDSADLRAALSNEWRAVASQAGTSGLRLVEPVFASAGSGSSHSFDSAPQGQFSSQQNPQQQSPSSSTPTGLRAVRPGANSSADELTAATTRSPSLLPTSRHLAAVA